MSRFSASWIIVETIALRTKKVTEKSCATDLVTETDQEVCFTLSRQEVYNRLASSWDPLFFQAEDPDPLKK